MFKGSNKIDASALTRGDQFQHLNTHLQRFIRASAQGQAKLMEFVEVQSKDIQRAISAAAQATQNHVQLDGGKTRDQVQLDGNKTRHLITTVQNTAASMQDRET